MISAIEARFLMKTPRLPVTVTYLLLGASHGHASCSPRCTTNAREPGFRKRDAICR